MDSPEDKAAGKFFSIICFLLYYFFVSILNSKGEIAHKKVSFIRLFTHILLRVIVNIRLS